MEIQVKTLNADGSVQFDGKLSGEQVQFVLGIGINYLLSQGAATFLDDNEDEDDDVIEVEGTDTLQ
jgi:hypothetical protein